MLIIPIKDGENIDRALKRFKRKFDKTGTKKSLQTRKEFIKPSVKRRAEIQKAQYVQTLRDNEDI
ncbi:MAG: 30S ribosomal protein S21 [Flavobacteriaceae bacterium]|jgi:small subunit ribosomal protein S21|nr:30S ribosomal protein S21 [Flavobacteriaceae bacterium]|tara:strand:- start:177 stop:371 length:195 start_codon:yes stop_codon:yes gene_type:complete